MWWPGELTKKGTQLSDGEMQRLGIAPKDRPGDLKSLDNGTCPDLLEYPGGVAVIGGYTPIDDQLRAQIEALGGQVGPGACMVVIPPQVLAWAMQDLPEV